MLFVSDGRDMMVFHTGNQSAFVGRVPGGGTSQLQDARQNVLMVQNWFANPNGLTNFDHLSTAPMPAGETRGRYFEQSRGSGMVIDLVCDPAKSYLADHRTWKMDGELFGDDRSTDPFEVRPGVWRPRKTVAREFITKRFVLSVQKDAKDARDHMLERSTLEVVRATPMQLDESLFRPVPPPEAQWVYHEEADGTDTPVVTPPGTRHRRRPP